MSSEWHRPYYLDDVNEKKYFVSKKLWWDNAKLLNDNIDIISGESDSWISQVIIVSAIRDWDYGFNTTSRLESIAELLVVWDIQEANVLLDSIRLLHEKVLIEQFKNDEDFLKRILKFTNNLFKVIEWYLLNYDNELIPTKENDYSILWANSKSFSLLGVGEFISAKIHTWVLKHKWVEAVFIDTSDILNDSNNFSEQLIKYFQWKIEEIIGVNPEKVPVVWWYVWKINGWILNLYWRGYTDAIANIVSLAANRTNTFDETVFNIQKMEDGFKTTDPRKLNNKNSAIILDKISYELTKVAISKELAEAWLINENALTTELIQANIKILVNNPHSQNSWTIIDREGNLSTSWVDLVLSRSFNPHMKADIKRFWFRYNKIIEGWNLVNEEQVLYLIGENFKNLWTISEKVIIFLKSYDITVQSGYSDFSGKNWLSLVFKNKKDTIKAQNLLHELLIENINLDEKVA